MKEESTAIMFLKTKFTRFVVAFLASSFLISSAFSQSENPGWIDDVTLQLLVDYECEVIGYEALHEGRLGGRNTYMAKAVCKDGRKYDASRVGEDDDFAIRICEVVRC